MTTCIVDGKQCQCQPQEGIICPALPENVRKYILDYYTPKGYEDPWQPVHVEDRPPFDSMDAEKWADYFCKIYPGQVSQRYRILTWFANVAMAGYDSAKREEEKKDG